MKKIRNVLIAIAVFSSLSVAAFASTESAAGGDKTTESNNDSGKGTEDSGTKPPATEDKNTGSNKENVDTGIGGIAAVAGVVTLAGAALAISRKRK